jgi:hypothetical protein
MHARNAEIILNMIVLVEIVLGKNAENWRLTLLQTVENCLRQLGKNAENVFTTLCGYIFAKNTCTVN